MRPETEADDRRHANGINDLNVVFSKEPVKPPKPKFQKTLVRRKP
jgi:hypothetical protein